MSLVISIFVPIQVEFRFWCSDVFSGRTPNGGNYALIAALSVDVSLTTKTVINPKDRSH